MCLNIEKLYLSSGWFDQIEHEPWCFIFTFLAQSRYVCSKSISIQSIVPNTHATNKVLLVCVVYPSYHGCFQEFGSLKCFILNLIRFNRFDFVTSAGQFVQPFALMWWDYKFASSLFCWWFLNSTLCWWYESILILLTKIACSITFGLRINLWILLANCTLADLSSGLDCNGYIVIIAHS